MFLLGKCYHFKAEGKIHMVTYELHTDTLTKITYLSFCAHVVYNYEYCLKGPEQFLCFEIESLSNHYSCLVEFLYKLDFGQPQVFRRFSVKYFLSVLPICFVIIPSLAEKCLTGMFLLSFFK